MNTYDTPRLATDKYNVPQLVTDKQLGELTPFSSATYRTWRTRGGGPPFFKRAGRVFYNLQEVHDWLCSDKHQNTSTYENVEVSE